MKKPKSRAEVLGYTRPPRKEITTRQARRLAAFLARWYVTALMGEASAWGRNQFRTGAALMLAEHLGVTVSPAQLDAVTEQLQSLLAELERRHGDVWHLAQGLEPLPKENRHAPTP